MERFRQFIGKNINPEKAKNAEQLASLGVKCTYLPDPPEEFDEFEFRTGLEEAEDIIIMVTIEQGTIQRIFFGKADENDPDIPQGLTGAQQETLLAQKGSQLVDFFDFITTG